MTRIGISQTIDRLSWKKFRRPGIEPGSTAWKAAMLTIIPPTPVQLLLGNIRRTLGMLTKVPPGCSVLIHCIGSQRMPSLGI